MRFHVELEQCHRSRNALELELLTLYMNQITNQINNVSQSSLNNAQIGTYTELITYDSSMNEDAQLHMKISKGEEICRIISCGHFSNQTLFADGYYVILYVRLSP